MQPRIALTVLIIIRCSSTLDTSRLMDLGTSCHSVSQRGSVSEPLNDCSTSKQAALARVMTRIMSSFFNGVANNACQMHDLVYTISASHGAVLA